MIRKLWLAMMACFIMVHGAHVSARVFPKVPSAAQLARYETDLAELASEPRGPGSLGWQRAQNKVAERFAALGYDVERHTFPVSNTHDAPYGVNIVGTLKGRSKPDESIVVSAHYDSKHGQCGADDNASGVAGVLAVADAFARTQPERTLIVAVWDQEEFGLIGSRAWAEDARKRDMRILHAYIYEMIGYRDIRPNSQRLPKGLSWLYPSAKKFLEARRYAGDSIVMIGTDAPLMDDFREAASDYALPALPLHVWWRLRYLCPRDLRRSDHDSFWRNGYQATMVTDSANFRNPNYHGVGDTADTIDLAFACAVVQTTVQTVDLRLNAH